LQTYSQDPTEYNGPESDVVRRMEERDTSWIPQRNSWRLQEAAQQTNGEDGGDGEDGGESQAQIQAEIRTVLKELLAEKTE
jgi:hypothetical protein